MYLINIGAWLTDQMLSSSAILHGRWHLKLYHQSIMGNLNGTDNLPNKALKIGDAIEGKGQGWGWAHPRRRHLDSNGGSKGLHSYF